MKTKIFELVTSNRHPLSIGLACIACISVFLAAVIYEACRRLSQRKKYERICYHCHVGKLDRRHVRVKLSPDLTGNFLTRLLSRMDYLCQTQATCLNPECSHKCIADNKLLGVKKGDNMPFAEKSEVKQWGFRSRLTRFKQLRHTVKAEQLISNSYVDKVLKERGIKPKVPKAGLTFRKQIVLDHKAEEPFHEVSPKK